MSCFLENGIRLGSESMKYISTLPLMIGRRALAALFPTDPFIFLPASAGLKAHGFLLWPLDDPAPAPRI
jgi:hypothetical protein